MRYDLHLHSNASPDCATPLESLIAVARRRGLDGLAVTDHDTMEGVRRLDKMWPHERLQLIWGCERTLADGSHLIGLFLKETPRADNPREVIAEIRKQGGLVYVPHPFREYSGLLGVGSAWDEAEKTFVLQNCDMIEVYNSKCTVEENARALKLLGTYPKAFAASSDGHVRHEIGTACTEFEGRLSATSFHSIAAYAPPKAQAARLADLRRGIESGPRQQAKRVLKSMGLLPALKNLRNTARFYFNPALERYL